MDETTANAIAGPTAVAAAATLLVVVVVVRQAPLGPRRDRSQDRRLLRGLEGRPWACLSRWLATNGQAVVEVHRADRARRRRKGKSERLDTEAAACAALPDLIVNEQWRSQGRRLSRSGL